MCEVVEKFNLVSYVLLDINNKLLMAYLLMQID
jgi:hypothetical protein